MAKQVQFRGGTTAEHASFTGAVREITVDTTLYTLRVHDGATAGGIQLAKAGANTDITSVVLSQTGLTVKGASANALTIKPNETLSAARTLNVIVNDADRTINLGGNLTVSSAATISGTNTGDQTITLTGDVTGSGTGSFAATIATNAVSLAKMAQVATASFLGRTTAGTGNVEALTAAQATALLNAVVGDSGSGGTKGLVPAPASGDAAAGKYLKADGTWGTVSASGGAAALWRGTITPTTGSPNGSATDTTNELLTITGHGLTTGNCIIPTSNAPGGISTNQAYYVNVANANQISFHTTYADAIAGTNKVNLTSAGAMQWRKLVYTVSQSLNMSSPAPVAFQPGTNNVILDFNHDTTTRFSNSKQVAIWDAYGLRNTSAAGIGAKPTAFPTNSSYTLSWPHASTYYLSLNAAGGEYYVSTTISTQSTTPISVWYVLF
jgi:hypothetical protein